MTPSLAGEKHEASASDRPSRACATESPRTDREQTTPAKRQAGPGTRPEGSASDFVGEYSNEGSGLCDQGPGPIGRTHHVEVPPVDAGDSGVAVELPYSQRLASGRRRNRGATGPGRARHKRLWDPVVHSYTGAVKRNVTVQLDDEVIRRAKVLAAKRGTSVSGLVGAELARLVAEDERYEDAWRRARKAMGDAVARGGRRWEREELHDR